MQFRDAIADLVPYSPGKPAEELMRERGLDSVIKLASNEGPWGPLPKAAAEIESGISGLNRYPDGAVVLLREALAELHGVTPDQVIVGHGADSIINNLSLAMLGPGTSAVFGWPSFPSYFLDAKMMGATPVMVPLTGDDRYDLDAMLEAIGDETRLVYICNPNNPTGTMVTRDEIGSFLEELPEHVLPVLDEAYFEYVDDSNYPDGVEDFFKPLSRPVVVLRTFSKIYGLAGLRVGYAVAPREAVAAVDKVRNAFDVTALSQVAAMATLEERHLARERADANRNGLRLLEDACRSIGLEPIPSMANFVCVRVGGEAEVLYDQLLDEGVIVRPLGPFGMTDAVRITVGTPEETARCADALRAVTAPAGS